MGSLRKYALEPRGPIPYHYAKFQPHILKHGETHSRTHIHTHMLHYFSNIDITNTYSPVTALCILTKCGMLKTFLFLIPYYRQLERYEIEHPDKHVILITFSQDVKVHGDGSQEPSHVAGDTLNDLDALLRSGQTLAHEMAIQPLNESGRLVLGGFALS